jgi:hypothetical protein
MLTLRSDVLVEAVVVIPLSLLFSVVDFVGLVDCRFHENCFMIDGWMDGWMDGWNKMNKYNI